MAQVPLIAVVQSVSHVSCNGGNNGSATVSVLTGIPPYRYVWSPSGGTGATATGLTAKTYVCAVIDGLGRVFNVSATITEPTSLSVTAASQTNLACYGVAKGAASVNVTGGKKPYSYNWTPGNPTGDGTRSVTGLSASTYLCAVTDSNGCEAEHSFTITQADSISANIAQKNVTCHGRTDGLAVVAVVGGKSPYAYAWVPSGSSTTVASGLAAEKHTLTVTDASGCKLSKSVTIIEPEPLKAIAFSKVNVACFDGATGEAVVEPQGGTAPYTYDWVPRGGTGKIANRLTADTYVVTVLDANECSATQSFVLSEPPSISVSSVEKNSCAGANNGSSRLTVTGGTPSYSYAWSPSGGTASSATGLATGKYKVTITDAKKCTAFHDVTILSDICTGLFGPSTSDQEVSIYPNPAKDVLHIMAKEEVKSIALYDQKGVEILQKTNTSDFSIAAYPSGIYTLKITLDKGVVIKKVQVE